MRTKCEVRHFLESLQWKRFSKKELEKYLEQFFGCKIMGSDGTCEDCKDVDYSLLYTTGDGCCSTHFIDIEIYYLKMRNRHLLITGTELLDYVK